MTSLAEGTLPQDAPAGLLVKLQNVAEAIVFFEKRGRNDHQNYFYVQAVDVVKKVRDELLGQGIIVLPGAVNARHLEYATNRGQAAFLTTVDLTYRFVDTATGEEIVVPWVGVGADTGGDKGIYKAFTGGLKYALQTTFLVPTTDDPERDQLTEAGEPEPHKDDLRPAAPLIPRDRAAAILSKAVSAGMAKLDLEASPGTPPEFHPAFQAVLALQGVAKIGQLNADTAEAVELWLANEEAQS